MKDKDFTIRALPKMNDEQSKIPHDLPQQNILFIAPSNSGKTTLIVNMILRPQFGYIEHYQHIFVFTPTLHLDNSWEIVQEFSQSKKKNKKYADITLYDEYDQEKIQDIFTLQEQTGKQNRKKILIILDDVADELSKSNNLLKKVFFKGRHFGISCWISSQSYKAIPRAVRINSPGFIFLNINPNEKGMLVSELSREEKKSFLKKFDHCLNEKYSFLYLNMKTSVDKMYCKNFNELIK